MATGCVVGSRATPNAIRSGLVARISMTVSALASTPGHNTCSQRYENGNRASAAIAAGVTFLVLSGLRRSTFMNICIVSVTLLALTGFGIAGLLQFGGSDRQTFAPFLPGSDSGGTLRSAATGSAPQQPRAQRLWKPPLQPWAFPGSLLLLPSVL